MCQITSATIVADGAAVGQALNNLAEAIQPEDPSLASGLTAAGNAIITATKNWTEGSTLADVIDAENAAIAVLNAIPVTSTYAPLVAIAFAALNLLISNAQTQSQQTASTIGNAKLVLTKAGETSSPWQGKAEIEHNPFESLRKNFENSWNKMAGPLGVKTVTV